MGIRLPESWNALDEVDLARTFLQKLNAYFFQTYDGIGTTQFQGDELQYFSNFHKFWEANHPDILRARIDSQQCQLAAQSLQSAVRVHGNSILKLAHETHGLAPRAIAGVRFFTANQDFRRAPKDQYAKYLEAPSGFDAAEIAQHPDSLLTFLGATQLSQSDKRFDFARNAARFLLERGIEAYDIAECFSNDARSLREALVNAPNMGYGLKKANMFIRDMVLLGVWPRLRNFDVVDVASDRNTMKVALRTRILQTDIPLLSSFLDIFCHQYGYIDDMSARAWRAVWEQWRSFSGSSAPSSPCEMDFLLYRIGREYCKEMLVRYVCDRRHAFYHFGGRLRLCRACRPLGLRVPAHPQSTLLPCQLERGELPSENGELLLSDTNLLRTFDGICIFRNACEPMSQAFRALNPPQSISIKGRTSWTESYAYEGKGGGGMMG